MWKNDSSSCRYVTAVGRGKFVDGWESYKHRWTTTVDNHRSGLQSMVMCNEIKNRIHLRV